MERRTTASLERFLPLLESHNAHVREKGAVKLGEELRKVLSTSHGPFLQQLLSLCVGSKRWETRLAAATALEGGLKHLVEDDSLLEAALTRLFEQVQFLSFDSVNLDEVFAKATPLFSKPSADFVSSTSDIHHERSETLRNLRMTTMRHMFATDDLFDQEEEARHISTIASKDHRELIDDTDFDASTLTENRSQQRTGLKSVLAAKDDVEETSQKRKAQATQAEEAEDRTSKRAKRSAREEAQIKLQHDHKDAERVDQEADLQLVLANSRFHSVSSLAELLSAVWLVLSQNLLSDRWESRHGACAMLFALLKSKGQRPASEKLEQSLEDVCVRCLCVLGMDRFGDFASDSVVAPVREACAQLVAMSCVIGRKFEVVSWLCKMVSDLPTLEEESSWKDVFYATLWGRRFGALLAMKYLVVVSEQSSDPLVGSSIREKVLPCVMHVVTVESQEHLNKRTKRMTETSVFNDDILFSAANVVLAFIDPSDKFHHQSSALADKVRQTFSIASTQDPGVGLSKYCERMWSLLVSTNDVMMVSSVRVLWLASLSLLLYRPQVDILKAFEPRLCHPSPQVRRETLESLLFLLKRLNSGSGTEAIGEEEEEEEEKGKLASLAEYFLSQWKHWSDLLLRVLFLESLPKEEDTNAKHSQSGGVEPSKAFTVAKEVWELFAGLQGELSERDAFAQLDHCLAHAAASGDQQERKNYEEVDHRRMAAAFAVSCPIVARDRCFLSAFIEKIHKAAMTDQTAFLVMVEAACLALSSSAGKLLDPKLIETMKQLQDTNMRRNVDFGPCSVESVLQARIGLLTACAHVCQRFSNAGLPSSSFEQADALASKRYSLEILPMTTNTQLVDSAKALVTTFTQQWLQQLDQPASREVVKRWNESAAAAQTNVMEHITFLEKQIQRGETQMSSLLAACVVFSFSQAGMELEGIVGPMIQPLLTPIRRVYQPPLDPGFFALVSRALGDLFRLLHKGGESRDKALRKLGKKIVYSPFVGPNLSVMQNLCQAEHEAQVWALLPDVHTEIKQFIRLEPEELVKTRHENVAAWLGCLSVLVGTSVFQANDDSLVVSFLGPLFQWYGDASFGKEEEEEAQKEVTEEKTAKCFEEFVLHCLKIDSLKYRVWACLHASFVKDTASLSGQQESLHKIACAVRKLRTLFCIVQAQVAYAFTPSLVPFLLQDMQDGFHPRVQQLAARCFSKVVELAPLTSAQTSFVEGGQEERLLACRFKNGLAFIDGLLSGVDGLDREAKEHALAPAANAEIALRDYQKEGVLWLSFLAKHGLSGALCDDLGLGKTLMSLTQMAGQAVPLGASIVVCPSSLTGHWVQEVRRWYPNTFSPVEYVGTPRDRQKVLKEAFGSTEEKSKHILLVVSYAVLGRDIELLEGLPGFTYCTLDEAHTIRNPYSKVAESCKRIGARAQHRLALTGTPVHNDVTDLWSVFDFLMPGYLGDFAWFEAHFGKPIRQSRGRVALERDGPSGQIESPSQGEQQAQQQAEGTTSMTENQEDAGKKLKKGFGKEEAIQMRAMEALESLHRRVLPFLMRRTKDEVLQDLPKKIIQDITVELSAQQQTLYEFLLGGLRKDVSLTEDLVGAQTQSRSIFSDLSRLLMACTHPLVCLRKMMEHAKNRLERRLMEGKISAVKQAGVKASCKFVVVEQLLRDHILYSRNALTGGRGVRSFSARGDLENSSLHKHKAILFAQWKSSLDLLEDQVLKQGLGGQLRYLRLDGDVKAHERQSVVNLFNEDPSVSLLLATTRVGGQGLNLTAADMVIFLENSWNPQEDLQAMDRAHRLGQKRCVHVFRILTRSTIEEKLLNLQMFKIHIASKVVDASNSSIHSMETDQILDAFSAAFDETVSGDRSSASQTTTRKKGLRAVLADLEELWGTEQYSDFDVASFARQVAL